jgi:hypothetical protein
VYTKVFRQIYDGTLADNWQALVTFQQLLILADETGVVDMSVNAIHRTTGIPVDVLVKGIKVLEAPDAGSRTPDMEGRRIVRMDEHRAWGWFLVNFRKYRQMISRDEKKEADRIRIANQRDAEKANKNAGVAIRSEASPGVADVAHTEAYPETEAFKALSSSLRSDSSSATADAHSANPEGGEERPNLALVPDAPAADRRAALKERLRQVTREACEAYNSILAKPIGLLPAVRMSVGEDRRVKEVKRCIKVAREISRDVFKRERLTREFWDAYFQQCAEDPHKSGRLGGGKGHENWRPDFEYLTRETVMLSVFEKAMAA